MVLAAQMGTTTAKKTFERNERMYPTFMPYCWLENRNIENWNFCTLFKTQY